MNDKETIAALTLARMSYFCIPQMRRIYELMGSFSAVMDNRKEILSAVPDCPKRIASALKDTDALEERAQRELEYDRLHNISPIILSDKRYPQRLRQCDDAPLVLFHCGNADLNTKRMVAIVGTRHATQYSNDCLKRFVAELHEACPQLTTVSGLAYGVDIIAHRQSLDNGVPTVAVLAHGLDTIYPARHRETANRMIGCGGLLTEFFTDTNADKVNFLRRNRIVAGMCDATVIVESAAHGGGLVTCRLANEYNREVFAFPGRIGDKYSEGCNNLIRDSKAMLATSAADLVNAMGWTDDRILETARREGIERSLFPNISPEAQQVVEVLEKENDIAIDDIASRAALPIGTVRTVLFELEMAALITPINGNRTHLIK